MKNSILAEKSYKFALDIIKVYVVLSEQKKEYVLSRQLLKSGTSIGANTHEAQGAQSNADFLSKVSIAYKEALETEYWIKLLKDSKILHEETADALLSQINEILRIIGAIQRTVKSKYIN